MAYKEILVVFDNAAGAAQRAAPAVALAAGFGARLTGFFATGYPISTVSYAIVCSQYSDSGKASLVKDYLDYAVTTGQSSADQLGFAYVRFQFPQETTRFPCLPVIASDALNATTTPLTSIGAYASADARGEPFSSVAEAGLDVNPMSTLDARKSRRPAGPESSV